MNKKSSATTDTLPLRHTQSGRVSPTDRYLSETRRIIERSKEHIAALCASLARTEEAIRRGKAALDPAGVEPLVVAQPESSSDEKLHLARRVATTLRANGYSVELDEPTPPRLH